MLGLLRRVAIIMLVFVILFVGVGFMLPSEWKVERSVVIDAPASEVYEHVGDLKKWQGWTPWNKEVDPSLIISYGEKSSGVGATQSWKAEHLGKGTITFTAASPEKGIDYSLAMEGGEMVSTGSIHFSEADGKTTVTWHDGGDAGANVFQRYFGYFFLDGMLGPDFDAGLEALKKVVESEEKPTTATP